VSVFERGPASRAIRNLCYTGMVYIDNRFVPLRPLSIGLSLAMAWKNANVWETDLTWYRSERFTTD